MGCYIFKKNHQHKKLKIDLKEKFRKLSQKDKEIKVQ